MKANITLITAFAVAMTLNIVSFCCKPVGEINTGVLIASVILVAAAEIHLIIDNR